MLGVIEAGFGSLHNFDLMVRDMLVERNRTSLADRAWRAQACPESLSTQEQSHSQGSLLDVSFKAIFDGNGLVTGDGPGTDDLKMRGTTPKVGNVRV